ncbi:MAG: hypothetical protein LWW82_04585 [Comamonadaceae bacterium]|jgi:hypothetical protein|nr:hypothetical protein [Comamonadaceae bacterium]
MTTPATVPNRILAGLLRCAAAYALLYGAGACAQEPARLEVSSDDLALPQAPQAAPLRLDVTQWLPAGGGSHLGFSLGVSGTRDVPAPQHPQLNTAWEPTLGVHWRSQLSGSTRLEVSTWARAPYASRTPDVQNLIWTNDAPPYGARLEVQWAAPRFGGLLPEVGAVGVKLEGNSQLLLRSRAGGPMLYYRSKF